MGFPGRGGPRSLAVWAQGRLSPAPACCLRRRRCWKHRAWLHGSHSGALGNLAPGDWSDAPAGVPLLRAGLRGCRAQPRAAWGHGLARLVASPDFKAGAQTPSKGFRALGVQNELWGQACSCSPLPTALLLTPAGCPSLGSRLHPFLSTSTPDVSQSRTVIVSAP